MEDRKIKRIIKKYMRKENKNMERRKNTGRKSNNILLVAVAVVLCIVVTIIYFIQQNNDTTTVSNTATEDAATEKKDDKDVQVIAEGKSLVIPVSDISSTASFYPVEVEGTRMEVLAVADSEGNIRTAFNTCQICYGSGRGYYVQEGNVLVCQNCGNRFTVDQVEIQSGGCNPWPIFPENKTITGDTIEISYDFLNDLKKFFQIGERNINSLQRNRKET